MELLSADPQEPLVPRPVRINLKSAGLGSTTFAPLLEDLRQFSKFWVQQHWKYGSGVTGSAFPLCRRSEDGPFKDGL